MHDQEDLEGYLRALCYEMLYRVYLMLIRAMIIDYIINDHIINDQYYQRYQSHYQVQVAELLLSCNLSV